MFDDLIAGCSDMRGYNYHASYYSVYFSAGRAYFISFGDDLSDGSSHYGNFLLRQGSGADPVTVKFVWRHVLDWQDEHYPDGYYFANQGLFAVVGGEDVGDWWDAISRGGELALSVAGDFHGEFAAPWGSSDAMSALVGVPGEVFDSAPAEYVSIVPGSYGTAMLAPGDYLFCVVGFAELSVVSDCTYEDIADARVKW